MVAVGGGSVADATAAAAEVNVDGDVEDSSGRKSEEDEEIMCE